MLIAWKKKKKQEINPVLLNERKSYIFYKSDLVRSTRHLILESTYRTTIRIEMEEQSNTNERTNKRSKEGT